DRSSSNSKARFRSWGNGSCSALRTCPKRASRHALPGAVDPNIARGVCSLTGKPQCVKTYARPYGNDAGNRTALDLRTKLGRTYEQTYLQLLTNLVCRRSLETA